MSNDSFRFKKTKTFKKNKTPFPQAYKFLVELEQSERLTVIMPPSQQLVEASRRMNGVFCDKCNSWDETGLEWDMIVSVDEAGDMSHIWLCTKCAKPQNIENHTNTYCVSDLPNGEETPFGKNKTKKTK